MKKHKSRLRVHAPVPLALLMTTSALLAAPPGPTPQIPDGGAAPGPYPNTSVSAVNVIAKGSSTAFNGSVEVTKFDGQGPVAWSVNRYNRGDFAIRLSPADPVAAQSNLGQGFIEFANGDPAHPANQAWRPSPVRGVVLATAIQNGPINWQDGEGPFYPTIAISQSSSGPGYDMVGGGFGNGNIDINTGRAGTHGSSPEANFAFSASWFPYDQGWLGGEVGTPIVGDPNGILPDGTARWTSPNAHSAGLTARMVTWTEFPTGFLTYGGLAKVKLPGVNSLEDGMLFAISSDGGSDVNILGVNPEADGNGWTVTIREDSATDAETLASGGQSEFQFVYIPFNAQRLVGGHVVGSSGAKRMAAGDFTVARTGTGRYEVTLPGKTGSDGTLLLQVADEEAGTSVPMASRAFLSYAYSNGKFLIESRKTTSDTEATLADASFYLAWVDFASPLAPPPGPTLRNQAPVVVNPEGIPLSQAGVAANTDTPELLVVSVDPANFIGYFDPISSSFAAGTIVGRFYDPLTLTPTSDAFGILGNPVGSYTKVDVKYNPVSKQYVVVGSARGASPTGNHLPHVGLVNPAATTPTVAKVFAHDPNTDVNYDDVAVAVSSKNGNFVLAAERNFTGEGEGTVGVIYDKAGNLLTPEFTRFDRLQSVGDEDDPDVVYLPGRDVFLYVSNTDNSNGSTGTLGNRVVGSVFATVPNANNKIDAMVEQILGDGIPAAAEGHPASLENPFNGQLITAFDVGGNNVANGHISYYNIGPAPAYAFTEASPEVPYLAGADATPFRHNHPQIAVDTASGVIAIGHNATDSALGLPNAYVVSLYGPDGKPLPSQLGLPYYIAESGANIPSGVNNHTVVYSPQAGSFYVVFNAANVTSLAGFSVTSSHLPPATPPTLAIQRVGASVKLSWPASAAGFALQSSAAASPAAWTAVGTAPSQVGDNMEVTVTPDGAAKFYRLAR